MILVIDNYDSFTYNLVQYLGELGADVQVYRNDKITVEQIEQIRQAISGISSKRLPTSKASNSLGDSLKWRQASTTRPLSRISSTEPCPSTLVSMSILLWLLIVSTPGKNDAIVQVRSAGQTLFVRRF